MAVLSTGTEQQHQRQQSAEDDDAVGRNALVWAHHDHVTNHELDDRYLGIGIFLAPSRGRSQLAQGFDRVARAIHGVALERVAEREQHQQQRRVRPVPDRCGADGSDQHQLVDVEHARAHRQPGVTGDEHPRQKRSSDVQSRHWRVEVAEPVQPSRHQVDDQGYQGGAQLDAACTVAMLMTVVGFMAMVVVVRFRASRWFQPEPQHGGANVVLRRDIEFVLDAHDSFDGHHAVDDAGNRLHSAGQRCGPARVAHAGCPRDDMAVAPTDGGSRGLDLRPQRAGRNRSGCHVKTYLCSIARRAIAVAKEMHGLDSVDLAQGGDEIRHAFVVAVVGVGQHDIEVDSQGVAHAFCPSSGTVPAAKYVAPAIASS